MSRRSPFFIVGSGRSGTTLVRTALAAHSRISVPPETHYFKLIDLFRANEADGPGDFAAFWAKLTGSRRFQDLDVDPERVLELAEGRGFRDIFTAMLAAYAEKEDKERSGEKTPGHAHYLDRIFDWFPDSRVIALRRDPRAVVASHLESPWVTEQMRRRGRSASLIARLRLYHIAERAHNWAEVHGSYLRRVEQDARVRFVRYEELVAHPEREFEAMTDFLGEKFEAAMVKDRSKVSGAAAKDKLSTKVWRSWLVEHERKTMAPISSEGVEKWRKKLTPVEVGIIEAICGTEMRRLGYTPELPRRISSMLLGLGLLRAFDAETFARFCFSRGRRAFFPQRVRKEA